MLRAEAAPPGSLRAWWSVCSRRSPAPPKGRARWSVHSMARHAGVSKSVVQQFWAHNDLKPRRTRTFKISRAPLFEPKFWDVIGLYLDPPQKAMVLCCDEKSQCQALERTQSGLPLGSGRIRTRTHDYTHHGNVPRCAFFTPAGAGSGAACGMKRNNSSTAFLPSLSAAFSPISMRATSTRPRRPRNWASPKPGSTNCAPRGWAGREAFHSKASGGAHRGLWPADVCAFLAQFVPLASPPNFQLVADELKRLFGFVRARSSVEAFLKSHLPQLLPTPPPRLRTDRRFRRAFIGELWPHDSSIHQWWPAAQKQLLLLTVDDHSGSNVAGRFVSADTTWNHFCHFRGALEKHGIPEAIYTDALSLFGPSSSTDRSAQRANFSGPEREVGQAAGCEAAGGAPAMIIDKPPGAR